jgi:hypothetical protein
VTGSLSEAGRRFADDANTSGKRLRFGALQKETARRSGLALLTWALVVGLLYFNRPTLRWASYEYIGPGQQTFHDAKDGRVTDAGWSIDWPENPDSILALVTYPDWTGQPRPDLTNRTATIRLRSDNLDLKGGHATFWIVTEGNRFHHSQPVSVDGTTVLSLTPGGWHHSWSRIPGTIEAALADVHSYGIAFVGFSEEPTGALVLEAISFR